MLLVDVGICDSRVSEIKVGVGTCDAGVSLIIVGDSAGLCRSWLFCWADSFCSSSSDVSYGISYGQIVRHILPGTTSERCGLLLRSVLLC